MSIIAVLLGLIFLGIVGLVLTVAAKMWKKASVKDKKAELELVNELADEVQDANEDLKVTDIDKKRKEIKKFTKT